MSEQLHFDYSMDSLIRTLSAIGWSYPKIYIASNSGDNRDAVFMKDLADILIDITAIMSVFADNGKVHPDYVLEKLDRIQSYITDQKEYWEIRQKEEV